MSDDIKKKEYEKAINKKLSKYDINPFILNEKNQVLLQQRISTVIFGGKWIMPGGKVFDLERIESALKRMTKLKTNVDISFYNEDLNSSLIGVYDDPYRDPREHVVGITFACKYVGGEIVPGGNSSNVQFFDMEDALKLDLGFGHDYMIKHAYEKLGIS